MEDSLEVDRTVGDVGWAKPGSEAGLTVLESFIRDRLADYGDLRNEPNADRQSNLSPWFHYGELL
jgi:deoxyribodipyrimidine photo-lyase